MKMKSVRITNFRTLRQVHFGIDEVTSLIGPNGVGKSSALRALQWFFSSTKTMLVEADITAGVAVQEIRVEVTFGHLSESDRDVLGRYVTPGMDEFRAWKTFTPTGGDVLSANARMFPPFADIRAHTGLRDRTNAYKEAVAEHPEWQLPAVTAWAQAESALAAWEQRNATLLEDAPEALATEFFGFVGQGRLGGLFRYVLVPAELLPRDAMQDGRGTVVGQLLDLLLERRDIEQADLDAVEAFNRDRQERWRSAYAPSITTLRERLEMELAPVSGGRALVIEPTESALKLPPGSFEVAVRDGEALTEISAQGHGFQRALLFAVVRILSEMQAVEAGQTVCIAIEEPEMYQHPGQAKLLARMLRDLANANGSRIQVIYATHSPYFVDADKFSQIRRFVRESTGHTRVHEASIQAVESRLAHEDLRNLGARLAATVRGELSSALFADAALVVEGSSDRGLYAGILERDSSLLAAYGGTELVVACGKAGVVRTHAILSSLGIVAHAVVDGDCKHRVQTEQDGVALTKNHVQSAALNNAILAYFDLPATDFPDLVAAGQLTMFPDDVESMLKTEWHEWVDERDRLLREYGLDPKKDEAIYRIAAAGATGEPPTVLIQALERIRQDVIAAGEELA